MMMVVTMMYLKEINVQIFYDCFFLLDYLVCSVVCMWQVYEPGGHSYLYTLLRST